AVAHLVRRATGSVAFRSSAPRRGRILRERPGNQWEPGDLTPHPPASVAGIRVSETSYGQRSLGIISDRKGRWLTAVLARQVVAFALLDPEAQERRLARWGLILSGTAATPIRRIQWIERTAPAQVDELARWLA